MRAARGGLVALGAIAYFAASLAWLARARPAREDVFQDGSAFNTSPRGCSLAYAYLGGRGRAVGVTTRALAPGELPADAVVFRVRPDATPFLRRPPVADEVKGTRSGAAARGPLTRDEDAWLREGGRLVLAIASGYGGVSVRAQAASEVRKVYPLWPGVSRVEPEPLRALAGAGLAQTHAVLAAGEAVVAARLRQGRGELIVLASPELLENRLLGRADHLALLEALAPRGRPVLFDEAVHGLLSEAGLLELLARWGLGPLLLLLLLAGLLALWRARVRVGPPEPEPAELRSDAVDLLDSLAQLYTRALRRDEAIGQYRASFARALSIRSGLRGEALEARVRALAGPGLPPSRRREADLPQDEFEARLHALNLAFRRLRHAEPE